MKRSTLITLFVIASVVSTAGTSLVILIPVGLFMSYAYFKVLDDALDYFNGLEKAAMRRHNRTDIHATGNMHASLGRTWFGIDLKQKLLDSDLLKPSQYGAY